MSIIHDIDAGWSTWEGEPRWRATTAALNRLAGAKVAWTVTSLVRVAPIIDIDGHTEANVATVRTVAQHRTSIVRIEGYEFWGMNSIVGHEHYKVPIGFSRVSDAKRFVETVLRQSGAAIVRRPKKATPCDAVGKRTTRR